MINNLITNYKLIMNKWNIKVVFNIYDDTVFHGTGWINLPARLCTASSGKQPCLFTLQLSVKNHQSKNMEYQSDAACLIFTSLA